MSLRRFIVPPVASIAPTLPTSFNGNILWLDPDDNATITLASGKAAAWSDKSGQSNNTAQPIAGLRFTPTPNAFGTVQGMLCNQANNTMMGIFGSGTMTDFSVFMVINCTSQMQYNAYFCSYETVGSLFATLETAGSNTNLDVWSYAVGATATTPAHSIVNGTTYCVGMTHTAGTTSVYINNVLAGSSAAALTLAAHFGVGGDAQNLGNFYGFAGLLGDVTAYNNVLSGTDQNDLYNNFFKVKYPVLP